MAALPLFLSNNASLKVPTKALALCCAITLLSANPTSAWTQNQQEDRLRTMSEDELEEDGWVYQGEESELGSLGGGLMALTVGSVAHGVGHLFAQDKRTGWSLFIGEIIGAGLMGAALLARGITNNDGGWAVLYESFFPLGAGLFAITWVLDIVGTFGGSTSNFRESLRSTNQLGIASQYTFYRVEGLPLSHAGTLRINFDFWPFYAYPYASLGVDENFLGVGAILGVRFGFGRREHTYAFFELQAEQNSFDDIGFSYWTALGNIGVSLDVGDFFNHMDGLLIRAFVGGGAQFFSFDFPDAGDSNPNSLLSTGVSMGTNPTERFMFEVGYIERPDALVGHISQNVGSFFATLTFAPSSNIDIYLDARAGRGTQLFAGTVFYLFR
ncbi:MAG: hypothetical protein KC561_06970 [Myxococcales bacterium]|nr:hypothetical protein [Myxococcales bacterium]